MSVLLGQDCCPHCDRLIMPRVLGCSHYCGQSRCCSCPKSVVPSPGWLPPSCISSPRPALTSRRRQLPDKYRPIISRVIGGDVDYDALHRWFNATFLIAATASAVRALLVGMPALSERVVGACARSMAGVLPAGTWPSPIRDTDTTVAAPCTPAPGPLLRPTAPEAAGGG